MVGGLKWIQTWTRRCDSAVPAKKTESHRQKLLYTPGNGRISPGFASPCLCRSVPWQSVSNCHRCSLKVDRAVQTFKNGMKKMNGESVETRVSPFLARYRITPQTSTGMPPAELLLGRKPRSRLYLVYPEIGRKVPQSQASQKLAHDWHAKKRTMRKGETVYANNFRYGPKWMMELVLKQSTGPASFAVQLQDGHQDHLIPRSSVFQEPIADQKVPHRRQLNSQNYSWKNP